MFYICLQGLWRIPSQEVDRAGSFAAHLSQALLLLLNVLKAAHDAKMLFFVHRQLATSPPNDRRVVVLLLLVNGEKVYTVQFDDLESMGMSFEHFRVKIVADI